MRLQLEDTGEELRALGSEIPALCPHFTDPVVYTEPSRCLPSTGVTILSIQFSGPPAAKPEVARHGGQSSLHLLNFSVRVDRILLQT